VTVRRRQGSEDGSVEMPKWVHFGCRLPEAHTDQFHDYDLGPPCFDKLIYGERVLVLAAVTKGPRWNQQAAPRIEREEVGNSSPVVPGTVFLRDGRGQAWGSGWRQVFLHGLREEDGGMFTSCS
jgi:hypothetical protein